MVDTVGFKRGRFQGLGIERVRPDPDIARKLKVPVGEKSLLRRENVCYADDDPVYRVTTWIPWSIAQDGEAYEVTRFVMRADGNGPQYNAPVE
ncbi:UTRA domain-containing protein [Streptomyces sp. IBSBF 2435]|uniref:UTRA domain-containing protein n=1 Tax=Streptomyces sp. IBSBF 2435 TaxID=2903531 RepID=UPI002FDC2F92